MKQADLRRVDNKSNGAVIDQFYLHHGAKAAGGDRNAVRTNRVEEGFVERFGDFRRRGAERNWADDLCDNRRRA